MKKIGLFGGCFNPIHYGHLILAETVRDKLGLDKIIFIPAGIPPHKKYPLASPNARLNMVRLAIQNNVQFICSDREIKQPVKSYTHLTLKYYQHREPYNNFFFLIGSDTLLEMYTWKKGYHTLDLCTFVVGTRPGFDISSVNPVTRSKIITVATPLVDISSTLIRQQAQKKQSIRYLTPDSVVEYMFRNKIYSRG